MSKRNGPGIIRMIPILVLVLCACAGQQAGKGRGAWQCSPSADAAFQSGDWQTALSGHEQLLASDPHNGLALYHLGYIMGHLGDRPREVALYREALACGYSTDDQLFFNLGMALGDLGDFEAACKALQTAISLNPDNPDNYFGLGFAEQNLGRVDEARKVFEQAVHLAPGHLEARLALARLLINEEQWDESVRHIAAVLAADPGNEEALELRHTLESRKALQYQ